MTSFDFKWKSGDSSAKSTFAKKRKPNKNESVISQSQNKPVTNVKGPTETQALLKKKTGVRKANPTVSKEIDSSASLNQTKESNAPRNTNKSSNFGTNSKFRRNFGNTDTTESNTNKSSNFGTNSKVRRNFENRDTTESNANKSSNFGTNSKFRRNFGNTDTTESNTNKSSNFGTNSKFRRNFENRDTTESNTNKSSNFGTNSKFHRNFENRDTTESNTNKSSNFGTNSKFRRNLESRDTTESTEEAPKFIKRKWKKDKIAAKKALAEGKSVQNDASKKPPAHSLFAVGQKDIYVKSNTRAKSVVEEVFSADKKFSDLNIHKYIVSNLNKIDFVTLTNVQEKSIPAILEGNNVLIRSQTGSGKTLAYAVPILDALQNINPRLQRTDGVQAIIVVPTRELALQTYELFGKINTFQWIVVSYLCGGENRNTEKTRLRKGVHILIATPGRLLDHMLHTNAFKTQNVRCLVLDEADRLLDMGFKKDIVKIVEEFDAAKKNAEYNPMALLKKTYFTDDDGESTAAASNPPDSSSSMPLRDPKSKTRQTLLLSATLTQGIAELADFTMKEHTYIDALDEFATANPEMMVIPKTVQQKFIVTHTKHRLFTLSAMLITLSQTKSKVFVFMGTSNMVDYHYDLFTKYLVQLPRNRGKLKSDNIVVLEDFDNASDDEEIVVDTEFFKLHGNMDQNVRKDVFTKFRAAKKGVLICTDVVARGIDVPTADCIIQYNGPQSIEDYLHRVGRTGRAGKSGTSYIFLTHEEQDFVTEMEKHRVYLQKHETEVFLKNLSAVMDEADHEKAAVALQKRFESALESDKELHKSACVAYSSWSRFYNTYSTKMRPIFDFKKANLGHYVTSFGLKESPTAVARVVRGQFGKTEAPRLNRKLQIHETEDKPRAKNPPKKKIKSVSLTTSEFSSGLEPMKKKRKKTNDSDNE